MITKKNYLYFVVAGLVLAVLALGLLLIKIRRTENKLRALVVAAIEQKKPATAPQPPQLLERGMKLGDWSGQKYAVKIDPANLSNQAKSVLTGFDMTTKNLTDGSMVITLTPKDSPETTWQYTVAKGNSFYFIEMSPTDDRNDKEINLRDDYGIVLDPTGVVL